MSTVPDSPPIAVETRPSHWRDFLELTKPKVSMLIVFTAVVGMVLATPKLDSSAGVDLRNDRHCTRVRLRRSVQSHIGPAH